MDPEDIAQRVADHAVAGDGYETYMMLSPDLGSFLIDRCAPGIAGVDGKEFRRLLQEPRQTWAPLIELLDQAVVAELRNYFPPEPTVLRDGVAPTGDTKVVVFVQLSDTAPADGGWPVTMRRNDRPDRLDHEWRLDAIGDLHAPTEQERQGL